MNDSYVKFHTPKEALEQAVQLMGGQSAFAAALNADYRAQGVTDTNFQQNHVWYWLRPGSKFPAEHCAAVERMTTGKIKRKHLRPDVFRPVHARLVA